MLMCEACHIVDSIVDYNPCTPINIHTPEWVVILQCGPGELTDRRAILSIGLFNFSSRNIWQVIRY
jgi:hypothetical protein